ncbi:MAG: glycerophosphodiester phosphodiesterase family protein [Pigmentiphaga sp.]
MIVAHRGNAAEFRENSIQAIRSALELGVNHIEFDVHLSEDLVPMLSHDSTLDRVFGVCGNVMDISSEELAKFGLARLDTVMMLVNAHKATAFVDLKPESIERFGNAAVVRVMNEIAGHVLVSWSLGALEFARATYGARIGWIVPDLSAATRRKCDLSEPDYLLCDQALIKSKLWPANWISYEVGSRPMMERLKEYGVSYFETMRVRELCCR